MEILVVGNRLAITQHQDPQIRNPNFMRHQFPQIRKRNPNENQIRPPFQENTMVDDVEENDDQIHCLDKDEPKFYIRKEDHDQFYAETSDICKNDQNNYQKGYQNTIMEFQKQYDLRNIVVVVNKDKNKSQVDNSLISQNKKDPPMK